MLAVRIDSNLRQCMRLYGEYVLNVIFSKTNKTDLPGVWCCVCFCLCAFGAILKRFIAGVNMKNQKSSKTLQNGSKSRQTEGNTTPNTR